MTKALNSDLAAVTGASGFIGRFVVAELQAQGVAVRALQHTTPMTPVAPISQNSDKQSQSIEVVQGQLNAAQTLHTLLDGARWVIHCAFAHEPGRYRGGEGANPVAFWQTNFGDTLALLEGCVTHGIDACTLLSSRAVFGLQTGDVMDDAATTPDTHYGALKVAQESLAAVYRSQARLQVRCVRATGVFGRSATPEQNKWWPLVRQVLVSKDSDLLDIPERTSTEVYAGDVARALWLSLGAKPEHRARLANSGNLNCSDLELTVGQLVQRVRHLAGRPKPRYTKPVVPLTGPRMLCPGLSALDWQPQGWAAIDATLNDLIAHYQQLNPQT